MSVRGTNLAINTLYNYKPMYLYFCKYDGFGFATEYRWSAQSVGADDEFPEHCVRQRHVQV